MEQWGRPEDVAPAPPKAAPEALQPNLGLSGKLAAETNKVGGVELKYQEPPESCAPDKKWRLYTFKGDKLEGDPVYLHRSPFILFGRDKSVADLLCAHPSISKQHAVLQFRKTAKPDDFGIEQWGIRPYLMDLETVNGTYLNGERVEPLRYYELMAQDVIKFGQSTRDYVLLYEELATHR